MIYYYVLCILKSQDLPIFYLIWTEGMQLGIFELETVLYLSFVE